MASSYPLISPDPAQQHAYVTMRRRGESHNIAEMCALQAVPKLRTDTTFLAGVGTLQSQFSDNEAELHRVVKDAKKQGYTPKSTDYYCPSLAKRCGDPEAFVPHDQPKSYVRNLCEKRDISCHGMVEVKRKGK